MNPKIRSDVTWRLIDASREPYLIVKDPGPPPAYYKYSPWEEELLSLLDGSLNQEEVAREFTRRRPDIGANAQSVADYVEQLGALNLLEKTEQERHLSMMDKAKTFRKKRFYDAEKSTLFQIHIPLFDPNDLMDRIIPWVRWAWSPWFVIPWLAIFVAVVGYLVYRWDVYWASLFGLMNPAGKTALDWALIIFVMFATGMWHELGHGFTLKRYGGEVHDIGLMIFYLEPAFYCAVEDSYLIPSRSRRAYVSFGGAYFELMICSVAMMVWLFTPAEWFVHEAALIVVLFTGLSLILFNMNPLIKLDGYYALMDLIDVPDLRDDSFAYIGNLIKKHLLHLPVEETAISRRRRRIYLVYGVLSILYTSTILIFIYIWVKNHMVGWFGPVGYLILFALIGYLMRMRIRDGVRFMKHFWLDKKDLLLSPRGLAVSSSVALALLLLLTVPRSPTRIEARFAVEPGVRSHVRALAPGVVRSVLVTEGDAVQAGTLLATLENPDLEAERKLTMADIAVARRGASLARRSGDAATEHRLLREAREAEDRLRLAEGKLARMNLRAAASGIVTTPRLEESVGLLLDEGDALCTVDDLVTVRLAVTAPELDIEEIAEGTPVRILADAYPGRPQRAEVLSLAPVARDPAVAEGEIPDVVRRSNLVRILIEVENPGLLLRPGMSGQVQFLVTSRSTAGKAWWSFSRWAGAVFW